MRRKSIADLARRSEINADIRHGGIGRLHHSIRYPYLLALETSLSQSLTTDIPTNSQELDIKPLVNSGLKESLIKLTDNIPTKISPF